MDQNGEDFVAFLKRRYPQGNQKLESELKKLKCKLEGSFSCPVCNRSFSRKYNMTRHVKSLHSQNGGSVPVSFHQSSDVEALGGLANKHYINPNLDDKYDILVFMANIKGEIRRHVKDQCMKHRHVKYYMNLQTEMRRQKDDGEEEIAKPHFRSKMAIVLDHNKFEEHDLNEGMQKIFASFDEYIRRGSSWTLKKILKCEVYTVKYAPVGASRYFQLPNVLSNTRSIININNSDEKCFLWSILASLYPSDHNSHRVTHYVQYEDSLDMIGIDYPVHPTSVPRFENQNNISVNVFGYEESSCFPLYISKRTSSEYHVDLLYICKEDTSHWCLIKNFNRFMNHVVKKGGYVFCKYCLQGFTSQSVLVKHMEYCSKLDAQHITYPTKGKDDILTFTEWTKKLRVPFVIYADFETFCEPMSNCSPDDRKSFSTKVQKFEPCGFGYQVVSVDPRYTKAPVIYRGVDVAKIFLQELLQEQAEINDILQEIEPLTMTDSNEQDFQRSTQCHICTKTFTASSVKVRDHCHVSGRYRGAACQSCNLNFKHPQFIPVVFHNLKGFDGHILCQALGFFKDYEINCIAQITEKYVSFSLGHLRFIDSYQFLGSSLGTLVEILASDGGLEHFHQLRDEFPNPNQSNLLLQKGVYCYEYVDSPEKFNRTTLPPIDSFYSHLTGETISDQDYEHARNVWSTMNMQNLGEYHDLYLKTDVLLLADVFEHFRDSILEYFHLDPCYFYTAPGLSWSAALRMTKCSLTLLTDPDMYLFFEQLRGGVSMISNKFAHANNPHVQDYDNSLPHTWIQYLDCNSLYAHTMTFPLPTGGFRWLSRDEVETLDITTIAFDGEKGYVLEVDLEYPDHLHDDHSDLPVAPEHIEVSDDQLSPYSKRLRPGVMKDEVPNKFIVSFVGLRANMYSFICNDKDETKIAKGVQKSTIENHLCFEQYKACLFEESEQMCESYNIRSENHSLYMTNVNKIGLSALDDKRFVLPDKCNTLAIGHYLTRT
ncbi:hypothetical protein FSP39_014438 [Pinctada imbricata]|uniref:DNA-directed DNA polymerase n=1 Tax=Pinctada imbricata TaxID=66713 RepID=A0AA88YPR3_PINIB|nr:hypothetical protein FSP39_014438 [Pinctada imbricata]